MVGSPRAGARRRLASSLVRSPGVEIHRGRAGSVVLANRVHGTRMQASLAIRELLAFFEQPRTLRELRAAYTVPAGVIDALVDGLFLIDPMHADVLRFGLAHPVSAPVGDACSVDRLRETLAPGAYAVFGVPTDAGAGGAGGARQGPELVRQAFPFVLGKDEERVTELLDIDLARVIDVATLRVHDAGDVAVPPGDTVASILRRTTLLVERIASRGAIPICIGGDHSVTPACLAPLASRHPRFSVVHFDAHHDLYPSRFPLASHATPFVDVLALPGLVRLVQLGLRTLEARIPGTQPVVEPRLRWRSSHALRALSPAQALADVPKDVPCYLSFDVDVLAPEVAPETGTPVPGGLSFYQALDLVEHLARHRTLIGADFVEVSGRLHARHSTAPVVARLMASVLLGRCPSRPLDTYHSVYP